MSTAGKSQVFADERQEPYTAAEHAAAEGHQEEYARDVPRTCICTWQWDAREQRYRRIREWAGCPWHTENDGEQAMRQQTLIKSAERQW